MISGHIEHQDSLGNKGILSDNEAQWMTSGSGIIHQEMPKVSKHLKGLQLWINLPQSHKMTQVAYWDIKAKDIIELKKDDQIIQIISKEFLGLKPKIQPKYVQVRILDITLNKKAIFELEKNQDKTIFIYVFEEELTCGIDQEVMDHCVVLFGQGDELSLYTETGSRFMVFEGVPLNEPIVFGGAIVMNTQTELMQAYQDFEDGTFIR